MTEEKKKTEERRDIAEVMPGFNSMKAFEFIQRAAKLLSQSTLVPTDFRNNLPNCVIALNMAGRLNADPLMVMQNLYIVHGRPGWSSQFLIATLNMSGKFSALRYEWVGTRGTDTWGCKAWATEKETGERLEGSAVTIDIAKKEGWYSRSGSKWPTMPDQMLMYRAASWFIRAYAPEIAMGLHTEEELVDVIDIPTSGYRIHDDLEKEVEKEIQDNANTEEIDMDPEPEEDAGQEEEEEAAKDEKPSPEPMGEPAQQEFPAEGPEY